MKLRVKYILFVTMLHTVALILAWFIFKQNPLLFIISEAFIVISIIISWQLYNQLIQPLKLLMQGVEAIKDKDFNVKFLLTGKYEMDELIKTYNQMIDELRAERTKQEQQHFFLEKLIQTSPTGIIILDYEDIIKQINPKGLLLLGLQQKDVLDKLVSAVQHPVMQQLQLLKSGESKTITFNGVITYKLQKSHFIDRGFPRCFIMVEELSAEILAAEKKAYGKVIRMMAHEVNNTIGPVNSILQSALYTKHIWENNENTNLNTALQVAFNRNNNLNVFMRNFADVVRLPEPHRKTVDITKLVHTVSKLMEMKAGEKQIAFLYNFEGAGFYIYADEQQMEQVLINIVKNAIEAIAEIGTVTFITNVALKQLVIADTGQGIDDETTSQLFSPFFSTKNYGQGIGLTLVKEILLNHGFEFNLKTVGSRDTRFEIRF